MRDTVKRSNQLRDKIARVDPKIDVCQMWWPMAQYRIGFGLTNGHIGSYCIKKIACEATLRKEECVIFAFTLREV